MDKFLEISAGYRTKIRETATQKKKNVFSGLCILSLIFQSPLPAQDPSPEQPPPLAPFSDIENPSEQTVSVEKLLSFLPEILARNDGDYQLTRQRLINEVGLGLELTIQQGRRFSEEEIRDLSRQLIDAIINLDIMVDLAKSEGFNPEPDEVADEIEHIKSQVSESEFSAMLTMQGLSLENLRQRITQKKIIDHWIENKVMKEISVSKDEVRQYYEANVDQFTTPEQIRISHILMKKKTGSGASKEDEVQAKLKVLLERIRDGENFARLAALHSECPSGKSSGDLGYIAADSIVPAINGIPPPELLGMKEEEVSNVIRTKAGYHIFKVTGRKQQEVRPLDHDLEAGIMERLRERKMTVYIQNQHENWKKEKGLKLLF